MRDDIVTFKEVRMAEKPKPPQAPPPPVEDVDQAYDRRKERELIGHPNQPDYDEHWPWWSDDGRDP